MTPGEMTYSGKLEISVTATSTPTAITLDTLVTAGVSQFLKNIGDSFQMYAFTKLRLQVFPSGSGPLAFGYQNEIVDTAPTTMQEIMDFPWNGIISAAQTVPYSSTIPRKVLLGDNMERMWRTQLPSQIDPGTGVALPTSNLWQSVQGAFWFYCGVGTPAVVAILTYTIRLSSPCAPPITPRPRVENLLGYPYFAPVDGENFWKRVDPAPLVKRTSYATQYGTLSPTLGKNCAHDTPNSSYIACWCPTSPTT